MIVLGILANRLASSLDDPKHLGSSWYVFVTYKWNYDKLTLFRKSQETEALRQERSDLDPYSSIIRSVQEYLDGLIKEGQTLSS